MIALEALCSRENDSVSYRVPLRVAALIGKDVADRESVFDIVSGAYHERSQLARGKKSKVTGMDAESIRTYLSTIEQTLHTFLYVY